MFTYRAYDGVDVSKPVRVDVAVQLRQRVVVRVYLPLVNPRRKWVDRSYQWYRCRMSAVLFYGDLY